MLDQQTIMQCELDTATSLMDDLRKTINSMERRIKQLEIQNTVFTQEKDFLISNFNKKLQSLATKFEDFYRVQDHRFRDFKQMTFIEFEVNENIRTALERAIDAKDAKVEQLEQALKVPREHYKFIEKQLAEEIV